MHSIFANGFRSLGLLTYNDTEIMTIFIRMRNKVFSDSSLWFKNKNITKGIEYKFPLDSSYVIINKIDYLNLYRSFNKDTYVC